MESSSETRWWDLPAVTLLFAALITAATRLVATDWTNHLSIVQNLVFFGFLAGLALGQSRFSPRVVGFFAIAYGLFFIPWQLGRMMPPGILWSERLTSLSGRLNIIFSQLANQEVVQDSLLFLVLMSLLFWVLSVHAGYTLVRYGKSWRTILPAGLALFVIHSFDALISGRAWYLAVYLFFSLVLVARISYLQQRERWKQSRTALPPHLGLDFIRFALFATAVIVVFAWTAPALADSLPAAARIFQRIKQPYYEARDHFDNAFASLRSQVGVVSDYYGNSLLLGRGNRLTDSEVFTVRVPKDAPPSQRYYWQARVYDTYENGQWFSGSSQTQDFNPQNDEYIAAGDQGRWAGTFDFYAAVPIATVFTPAQPEWISRPAKADVTSSPGDIQDLSAFRADPTIQAGETYQVHASVDNATIAQLQAAGSDYPDWVKQRYLQLPDSITPRTRQLAIDITANQETPYDKAVAVTDYLRNNIQYSDSVPNKPTNQETIDWFLFDLKKGFCNYYSTAEVVLLRSVGIPARWAAGYAQGERLDDGSFYVRQKDAHAWPEVYFPGIGWVEFEPTASQPVLVRLAGDSSQTGDPSLNQSSSEAEALQRAQLEEELALLRRDRLGLSNSANTTPTNPLSVLFWALPLTLGLAILFYLAYRARIRFNLPPLPVIMESSMLKVGIHPPKSLQLWARRAALPPIAKAYQEINYALARLGSKPAPTETPAERAETLVQVLPVSTDPVQRLINAYQIISFSQIFEEQEYISDARQAGSRIRLLSYKAMIKYLFDKLLARVQRPSQPIRGLPPDQYKWKQSTKQ